MIGLLALMMAFGEPEPSRGYQMYPVDPATALPFDASRLSPWLADFNSSYIDGSFAAAGIVPAPDPSLFGSSILLAQASATDVTLEQENLELRQRIEQLELMMQNLLSQPPVPGPQPVTPASGMQSFPGWLVELHPWNERGILSPDPLRTVLTRNCPFNGRFGQTSNNQMFIYRMSSTFRVEEPGRYVFAVDTTCDFDHACTMQLDVDGTTLVDFSGETEDFRLQNGIPLTVGDHTIELRTWLNDNSFLNFRPTDSYLWQPLVNGPSDLNARDFRDDELFGFVPAGSGESVQSCSY